MSDGRNPGGPIFAADHDLSRRDQIEIARRNIANGIPDSRWCGDGACTLNGMEHGHFKPRRHPVFLRVQAKRPHWAVLLAIAIFGLAMFAAGWWLR